MNFKKHSLQKMYGLLLFLSTLILLSNCKSIDTAKLKEANTCPAVSFTPPAGLKALPQEPLPKRAKGAPTQGGLCSGTVYLVEKPVKVYRVWSSDKGKKSTYGGWWSLDEPKGPRDAYRKANNICPSWSKLDRMSSCMVKVGTKIAIGPGQSAFCKTTKKTFPTSSTLQVYIPNYYDGGQIYVEKCSKGVKWP